MPNNFNLPASGSNRKDCQVPGCDKSFTRERDWSMHVVKQHGGTPNFECPAPAHVGHMCWTRLSLHEHIHKVHGNQEAQLLAQANQRYPDPYAAVANAPQAAAPVVPVAQVAPVAQAAPAAAADQYAHLPAHLRPNTDPLVAMARQALDLIPQRTDFSEARYQILDVDSDDDSEMFPGIPRR